MNAEFEGRPKSRHASAKRVVHHSLCVDEGQEKAQKFQLNFFKILQQNKIPMQYCN
jgi:hypothetical protein